MSVPAIDPVEFEYLLEFAFACIRDAHRDDCANIGDVAVAAIKRYHSGVDVQTFVARFLALQGLVDSGRLSPRYYTPQVGTTSAWLDDRVVQLAARFPVSARFSFEPGQFLESLQEGGVPT